MAIEIADEDWLRFFETNVMSGVRLTRHYLPGIRRKDWGRVVFVSSESSVQIPVEMIHYGMTKTAQIAIARGVAESVAGTGITGRKPIASSFPSPRQNYPPKHVSIRRISGERLRPSIKLICN
jgi:short-subunit dehydrogenase